MGGYIDQSSGLGGSEVGLLNLGFPTSGTAFGPGVDLTQLLNDLGLAPSPLTGGPAPPEITIASGTPTTTIDLSQPIPIASPLPVEVPLPPPEPLPPIETPPPTDIGTTPVFTVTHTEQQPTQTAPPPQPPPQTPITVTTTAPGGGGPVTVNVTVNNAENIANDVIQRLQEAVTQGIADSVQKASDIAANIFQKIGDILKNIAQSIWDALKTALQAIASQVINLVQGLGNAIANAATYIFHGLETIFSDLKNVLIDVINKIGPVILKIAETIDKINKQILVPISNFINTVVRTIGALTIAIEKDLHDGLAGIVRIPGDIATGISGIDASLNRTVQELAGYNQGVANSVLLASDNRNIADHLKSVGDSVVGLASKSLSDTTFMTKETLGTSCSVEDIAARVANIPQDFGDAPDWLKWAAKVVTGIFVGLSEIEALMAKNVEAAEAQLNKSCPLKKLDANTLVQAWMRAFIDASQMDDELAYQGIDANRSKLLRDLSRYVETTQDLAEYRYRNIISDTDFVNGLRVLGFTDVQIDAYRQSTQKLLDPQTALLAWQRGILSEDEVNATLGANRYDADQTTLAKTLAYRPPNTDEALAGTHNREVLGQVFGTGSDWDAIPDWYQSAGRAQGFDDNTIRLSWWVHFFTGDIQTWIILYFRGIRTLGELTAFMDSRGVPREFQNDLVEANRPLLQFRSVPTYVRAGVISDARARSILSAHGFSLEDINAIMDAATKQGKSVKATAASSIQTLSIANAKTLYNDGALDQSQYVAILEQHGYTPELANAQAQVDAINAHARHRKQTLSDYAAQVEAGVLTLDDAIGKLQAQGFTVAEIQTWQARVIHALKIGQKHPSLSELDKFLKANLITLDDYRSELQAQGWADPWLSAFVALVTPTPTQ